MRGLALIGVLLLCGAAQAQAPGAFGMGLPPVLTPGGWARYLAWSSEGPTAVVVRVGKKDTHRGVAGTWLELEARLEGGGAMRIDLLVRPEKGGMRLLRVRTHGPGGEVDDAPLEEPGKAPAPKKLGAAEADVAGTRLQVTRYGFPGEIEATWSPRVPGLGMVRVTGPAPMQLVAFGRGGDPWAGAEKTMEWPKDLEAPLADQSTR